MLSPMNALDKAVKAAGGVTSLAESLGVGQSVVSNWRKRKRVPPGHVIRIEEVTGISRHELCPAVFGPPSAPDALGPGLPAPAAVAAVSAVVLTPITKRELRARLGLASDAHLAKVLQLPTEEVERWQEEQGIPALPQVLHLLGASTPVEPPAPMDIDDGRIIDVDAA